MSYFIIFKHLFVPKKEVILKLIIIVFKVLHIKLHLSPYSTDGSNYAYTMLSSIIFIRPSLRRDVLWYTNVRLSVRLPVRPFHMSRSNLRTSLPIHFKLRIVIGIDSLMVCILFGEISIFHSRVMAFYSSNCRWFFVCRAVNWEPLGQFTLNFA